MIIRDEKYIMRSWRGSKINPVVSICCTTYNHENFISDAIDGFLMQETDFPFEVIIRDDSSTDKTALIIRHYAEEYPNIIKPIYETENQFSKGVKPMSVVYKKAVGKYFALCEGDDYWTDSLKLQIQVNFLEENPGYIVTYTSLEAFDKSGVIKNYIAGATYDLDSLELKKARPLNTLTTCFRNVLNDFPPEFECAKTGDLFLWSLLGHYGKGKFLDNIKPSRYRIHEQGLFSKKTRKHQLIMISITHFALCSYYIRMNDEYLSDFFYTEGSMNSIKANGKSFYIKNEWRSIRPIIVDVLVKLRLRDPILKLILFFKPKALKTL